MEEAGDGEPKTRRYGLRSRGNVNSKPPVDVGRRAGAPPTARVLKDETARVANVARTRNNTRNKTKTGPRKEVEVVQETTENIVAADSAEAESSENVPPFDEKVEDQPSPEQIGEENNVKSVRKKISLAPQTKKGRNRNSRKKTKAELKKVADQFSTESNDDRSPVPVNSAADSNDNIITEKEQPKANDDKSAEPEVQTETKPQLSDEAPKEDKHVNAVEKEGKDNIKEKKSFFDLPTEEQLLIVRKKLEKIIHGKETNQNKALDLLRILERTKMTEQMLDKTKIDLTLEALKFVIKDANILKKTDGVLRGLKKLKKKDGDQVVVQDKKWRKKEDIRSSDAVSKESEVPSDTSNSNSNSTLHWMDKLMQDNSKKMEVLDRKLDSLKCGVRDIQPKNKQEENNMKTSKTESLKDPTKSLTKIVDKLKSLSVDDEKAYHYLKDLSHLKLDDKTLEKISLEKITALYKNSSNSKIRQISAKILGKIESTKKSKSELDQITNSIVQMKIREKEVLKKNVPKPLKTDSEVREISKTVEKISLAEPDPDPPKLFTKPSRVLSNKPNILKEEAAKMEAPDSLLARLKKLEVENKIHKIKMKLDDYTVQDDMVAMTQLLKDLDKMDVTLELLETTRIGLSLNSFRKRIEDKDLARIGKEIVRKWKSLIPEPKQNPEVAEEEAVVETEEEKQKRLEENREKIRSHCRTLLLSALTENKSVPQSCSVDTEKLAGGIEEAIFDQWKEVGQKYRSQVQSRQFNIRKNSTLRDNLLVGNITPDEVAVMSHEVQSAIFKYSKYSNFPFHILPTYFLYLILHISGHG